jgi:hypothetical protein
LYQEEGHVVTKKKRNEMHSQVGNAF